MTTYADTGNFEDLADPFRPELMAHCYRMLGSVHDAEDVLQETLLRAWRGYGRFEGRSSLRTWLYHIATNACLSAVEGRKRRPMPSGLGAATTGADDPLVETPEVPWLEPIPDGVVLSENDPAAVVVARESLRLALIAALQHVAPRQRAVLIFRDVLRWSAAEVATALDTSTAAVNSLLQRARAQLDAAALRPDDVVEPADPDQRVVLERYAAAFEAKDVGRIVELLTADASWEMPPFATWYRGRSLIAHHLTHRCPGGPDDFRLLPIAANGQPGFALYLRDNDMVALSPSARSSLLAPRRSEDRAFRPFALQVLTLGSVGITHVGTFFDLRLFDTFELPPHV